MIIEESLLIGLLHVVCQINTERNPYLLTGGVFVPVADPASSSGSSFSIRKIN